MDTQDPSAEINTPDINLSEFTQTQNLAPLISRDSIEKYRSQCLEGLEADRATMSDWLSMAEDAMELAKMDNKRDLPFDRAADVQAPTLMSAAMHFAARAYPTIMADDQPAKVRVFGADETGEKSQAAERVSKFMSWQLTEGMPDWEEELDLMLHSLPITGCEAKKVYFCSSSRQTISKRINIQDLVLNAKSTNTSDMRISQKLMFQKHEIEERVRRGQWLRVEALEEEEDEGVPVEFLEQHCRLDIDEDGYAEPYIVTLHQSSGQIVRIQANYGPQDVEHGPDGIVSIRPSAAFVFFPFLPDPEYPALGIGLGHLMLRLGKAINSTLNQLLDAGALQNTTGGLIDKNVRINGGNQSEVVIDEWQFADLSMVDRPFVEFPRAQPSAVLFSLLGFLVDMAKDLSSTTDALTGDVSQNMQPTTLLALIEQGAKVYSAAYKRIFRAMRKELRAIFRVNAQNIDPHMLLSFHDSRVQGNDFQMGNMDVAPTADPNMANDSTQLAKAAMYQQFVGDPFVNQLGLRQEIFKSAKLDLNLLNPPQEGPDMATEMAIADKELASDKLALDERKQKHEEQKAAHQQHLAELDAQIRLLQTQKDGLLKEAQAVSALASAEAQEAGTQIQAYQTDLNAMKIEDEQRMRILNEHYKGRMGPV